MTPAIRFLEQHKAIFTLHQYDCTAQDDFGAHAAGQLGVPPARVFKTLLTEGEQGAVVALVPSSGKVNLKRLAKAAGVKKLDMMPPQKAERLTGYKVGGISPFAQKKRLPTVLDASALEHDSVLVSGGKRGLSVGLAAEVIAGLLQARIADIAEHD
ncbi:Cys-tRNA(Pro) deacylase [Zobellella taiwanensis]|jgi:Cys-tRNA(Pro)/Cys-tRNA(Cys) deacylase|uniref:Cys-tRNA(Pro)/Cys-tRNA(Cys) deacylase n=1 Tax=Zobellella taiwanensis TaxID=347535 RepID=A0A2P7QXT0_9GAMM|nr:Cys-tRNA(Pro) deacylase [Zobellella taiwanensis]PSJ42772.1 Cys-tRNA(Pro) deacylase [Zobellella taiwanensis]